MMGQSAMGTVHASPTRGLRAATSLYRKCRGLKMPQNKARTRMRFISLAGAIIAMAGGPQALLAATGITAPNVTVGRNLEMYTSVRLPQPASEPGVQLTLTSDDPSRLLLSAAPDKPGSATLSLTVRAHLSETPEFWVQGLADSGEATYTISAGDIGSAKGTVKLAPSAILILGPSRVPVYPTTPRGSAIRVTILSAALDSSLKVVGEQSVAGGSPLEVTLANSNPQVGTLGASKLILEGGSSTTRTSFQPSAEGDSVLAAVQPHGFTAPAEYAKVTVSVGKPGLSIVGELYLGKDLQMTGVLCLGEPAPPGGLKVTLTSANKALLISDGEDKQGSASVVITVPAGQLVANYYLQALAESGEVTYQAEAPGFKSRTARIGLAQSGVIVASERYGPPDEAAVKRRVGPDNSREFYASLADAKVHPVQVGVWTAHLDPINGKAADITVQALRPGVNVTVALQSSNPDVATVESPLTIKSGATHAVSRFTPVSEGRTIISINTPDGFTTPKNATSVPATVSK
jgi:hypothetical protein